ncbi:deleted in malignant brain tumors 1 protein-like, partial [Pristis pectinata]|uniref:deleted in malignant brain tumors 1 protein-like n=1 Tax=Pristis pectinata TaxID=685728 RepID=UPI00223E8E1D
AQTRSPETEGRPTDPTIPVRLQDGGSECSGRVELLQGGQWRPLCREFWANQSADVLCRELDCGTGAISDRDRGHPGPHWVGVLNCSGQEPGWQHCPYTALPPSSECDRNLSVLLTCTEHREIRLADGGSRCAGRVEIRWRGEWGTVCDDGWDMSDAEVVCRQLGCGRPLSAPPSSAYGPGRGPIFLDQLGCQGNETYLWACPGHAWRVHDCGHKEDASVECSGHREIRLSGGPNRCEGGVAVREHGVWGALCSDAWDEGLAHGVCAYLGCGNASALPQWGPPTESELWTSHCVDNTTSIPACLRRLTDGTCATQAAVVCSASFNMTQYFENFTSAPDPTGREFLDHPTPSRELVLLLIIGVLLLLLAVQTVLFITNVLRLRRQRVLLLAQPSRTQSVVSTNDYREMSISAAPAESRPAANNGPRLEPPARRTAGSSSSSSSDEYEQYDTFAPKAPRDFSTFKGSVRDHLGRPGTATLNPAWIPQGQRAQGVKGRGSSKRSKRSEGNGSPSGENRAIPRKQSSRCRRVQIPRQASEETSSTSSCEWYENTRHESENEEPPRMGEVHPELLALPVNTGLQSSTSTLPLEEYENVDCRVTPQSNTLAVAYSGTGQEQEDSTESDYDDIATYATS